MAKDPAFLFYPGDYLRDTQCLSEKVQVAYDRIMCEHMRNICISQSQFNFFTKKLNDEEKEELKMVLTEVDGGFQIEWVVLSISKRRAYSESRSKNKAGKTKKDMKIISKSYDNHMENANEIVYYDSNSLTPKMVEIFKVSYPHYPVDEKLDYTACLQIAYRIAREKKWQKETVTGENMQGVLDSWEKIVQFSTTDKWYSTRSISDFHREFQRIVQGMTAVNKTFGAKKQEEPKPTAPRLTRL